MNPVNPVILSEKTMEWQGADGGGETRGGGDKADLRGEPFLPLVSPASLCHNGCMKTTLQYSTSPSDARHAYRQRIVSKIGSFSGIFSLAVVFVLAFSSMMIARIPWRAGLAPSSLKWVLVSIVIVVLGVLPLFSVVMFCIVYAVQTRKMRRAEGKASMRQTTLAIDDGGLAFETGADMKSLAWDEVANFEATPDYFIFAHDGNLVFIPRKAIPSDVQTFIRSKSAPPSGANAVHADGVSDGRLPCASRKAKRIGRAILIAILIVFAVGILLMLSGVLSWFVFS